MAKTPSKMIPLGSQAPLFCLLDVVSGQPIRLNKSPSVKGTVIMFICNHCPYVKHIQKGIVQLANDYATRGIQFIAINSNDIENYPDDSPENMKLTAIRESYPFPYLFDENQDIAKAYQATCTPDFFVYDTNLNLIYRGQFDDSRPGNQIPITGDSIRSALDCLLEGKPVFEAQKPSLGCNIKWKM
ncbi:putative thiol-disulfide isomerase and thioredoxins family [Legionella beliardensis]|uniref:Putative thiol-disulfide isomerase and thioredoxins family n=1 Tax=Legionella beliardensis TaxID=91822 RepID=A0A378I2E6_9GAMM|nr:thioredoxin family protein [Legionella beliardensis]STX29163.1 putative thiol-disulfide isomerase and thioredoxins family [Legionella beliardensis]